MLDVYDVFSHRVQPKMPVSKEVDPLLEIDRNARKLDLFLSSPSPMLNVSDLRHFLPYTINVDPYLRKLIRGTYVLGNGSLLLTRRKRWYSRHEHCV